MPRKPKRQLEKVERSGDTFTWTFRGDYEGIGAPSKKKDDSYFYMTILEPFKDSFMKMLGLKK